MLAKRRSIGLLGLATLALTGCTEDDDVMPLEPGSQADNLLVFPAEDHSVVYDSILGQLAREIPGFGGFYLEGGTPTEQGSPVVLMVDVDLRDQGERSRAQDVLSRVFPEYFTDFSPTRFRDATYDFIQLNNWHWQLLSAFTIPGVTATDVDETTNRIVIGVDPNSSEATRTRVQELITEAGVPSNAVAIEEIEQGVDLVGSFSHETLQDRHRPTRGGHQIYYDAIAPCTLGVNARTPNVSGTNVFITASHCSLTQAHLDNTKYYQPWPILNDFIGIETYDSPWIHGQGPCPSGHLCRYSDVNMVTYDGGTTSYFRDIARPIQRVTSQNPGPIQVQDAYLVQYQSVPDCRTRCWYMG